MCRRRRCHSIDDRTIGRRCNGINQKYCVPSFVFVFLPLVFCCIYPLTVSRQYYNNVYSNSLHTPIGGCQLVKNKEIFCHQYRCCNLGLGLHDVRGDECHFVSEDKTNFWQGRFDVYEGTTVWSSTGYSNDDCSYVGESVCATYNVSLALPIEQMNVLEEEMQSQLLMGWVMEENQLSYKNMSTNVLTLNHDTGRVTLPLGTVFTSNGAPLQSTIHLGLVFTSGQHPGASAGNGSPLQLVDLDSGQSIVPYIFQSFMYTMNIIDVKQHTYNDCKYVFETEGKNFQSGDANNDKYFQVLLAPSAQLDNYYLLTSPGEKMMLLFGGIFGLLYLLSSILIFCLTRNSWRNGGYPWSRMKPNTDAELCCLCPTWLCRTCDGYGQEERIEIDSLAGEVGLHGTDVNDVRVAIDLSHFRSAATTTKRPPPPGGSKPPAPGSRGGGGVEERVVREQQEMRAKDEYAKNCAAAAAAEQKAKQLDLQDSISRLAEETDRRLQAEEEADEKEREVRKALHRLHLAKIRKEE